MHYTIKKHVTKQLLLANYFSLILSLGKPILFKQFSNIYACRTTGSFTILLNIFQFSSQGYIIYTDFIATMICETMENIQSIIVLDGTLPKDRSRAHNFTEHKKPTSSSGQNRGHRKIICNASDPCLNSYASDNWFLKCFTGHSQMDI